MSIFVQEVLGLLKRNFVKKTLNPTDDYFQFVRKGALSRAKTSAGGFAPQGQALSISAGSWLCSQTGPQGLGRFVSTVKNSGDEVGVIPMFWLKQGQCSWHSLKDSIITQDTASPLIFIGQPNKQAEFITYGKAYVTSLTDRQVMIAGQDGLLSGTEDLTYGPKFGTAGTFLENRQDAIFGTQNTTIGSPCFPPQQSFTMWSRLNLYGSVHFQGPNSDGAQGQIMVQTTCGRLRWEEQKSLPDLQFGELVIGYQNPQPAPGTIVPAVGSFTSGALGTGNNNDVLTSGGPSGFPSWAPNPGINGSGTNFRISMFTPDGVTIANSLMIQDGNAFTPATTVTNDGKWINTGTMKLLDVAQDATQEKVLVLDASTGLVKFRFANSMGVQGSGTLRRVPLWSPDGDNIQNSLLIQSDIIQPPANYPAADPNFTEQKLTNDGSLQQTKELYLDTVAQDDTLTEVLVRHPSAANEVKFRDVATIVPPVGFDTLPMSTTADWNQTFLNAYISLDDTTVPYRSIKGMTTLTDGQTGVVIVENVKQTTFLADNVLRFPIGWGTPGNLYDSKISWAAGVDNGYPTSTLKYGESLKFKYHNYEVAGGGFTYKYILYWESCCKLFSLNTCPTVSGGNYNVNEDDAGGVGDTVTFVDDGYGNYTGVFTASALSNPAAGTFTFDTGTGTWLFIPALNFYGSITFTFTYNDGYCESDPATITINVLPVAEAPIWTSDDPVTLNTYPALTGGDAWTYTWTTSDADHPCSDLKYTITVNENNTGPVTIFTTQNGPVAGVSWLTFTPDPNNNCTGTLSGTYPATGGNFEVVMTVEDPDPNFNSQTFTIGGILVSKDTYFCFYSDTSGSMNSTIITTAIMSSVPEVKAKLHQNASGVTMVMARGNQAGRVNDANGETDQAHLCIVDDMLVSGPGVPVGTTVLNDGAPSSGLRALTLSLPSGTTLTSQTGDIITFTRTQAQKTADYTNTTSFRNLLQDFYATGGTAANNNTNTATNGQDDYDNHLYWFHNGQERPLGYLGFQAQGGALVATIGAGTYPNPFFPSAKNIVVMAWADESGGVSAGGGTTYEASPSESGSGTWNDRVNTTNATLLDDISKTRSFITIIEAQAANAGLSSSDMYRGIAFRVTKVNADGSTANNDLEEIMGPGGFAQTGGRFSPSPPGTTPYSNSFAPQAFAYSENSPERSFKSFSNGAPKRITYVGNVSDGASFGSATQAQTYYYGLVKSELISIGFNV